MQVASSCLDLRVDHGVLCRDQCHSCHQGRACNQEVRHCESRMQTSLDVSVQKKFLLISYVCLTTSARRSERLRSNSGSQKTTFFRKKPCKMLCDVHNRKTTVLKM